MTRLSVAYTVIAITRAILQALACLSLHTRIPISLGRVRYFVPNLKVQSRMELRHGLNCNRYVPDDEGGMPHEANALVVYQ